MPGHVRTFRLQQGYNGVLQIEGWIRYNFDNINVNNSLETRIRYGQRPEYHCTRKWICGNFDVKIREISTV